MAAPVFIFSLPRSGSTLLQKILMAHTKITGSAEPWILLPLFHMRMASGTLAWYSQRNAKRAIDDFIAALPEKEQSYKDELARFITNLYSLQCENGETYFIDKTPRYYLIIPEIVKLFPSAKCIFLFRNPLDVFSSILSTWCDNSFKGFYNYEIDLQLGSEYLQTGLECCEGNAISINYEELVIDPERIVRQICGFLETDFEESMIDSFGAQLVSGGMGDRVGAKKYRLIANASIASWKKTINTNCKKRYAIRYLGAISNEMLVEQGFLKSDLMDEVLKVRSVGIKAEIKDWFYYLKSSLIRVLKPNVFFGRTTSKWAREHFIT